jgi:hypothetical protein
VCLDAVRRWYEDELGWATTGEQAVELPTGARFDVLELPADAGFAVLRRLPRTGPVALEGQRMRLLVAVGGAEELPGLLDWLEWGGIALDLTALGAGGRMAAPWPPTPPLVAGAGAAGSWEAAGGRAQPVWLRPPDPGRAVEPALPTMALGAIRDHAPDLTRLVAAAATECHRARLLRASCQALAFSYASRTVAGTRPRSLTS